MLIDEYLSPSNMYLVTSPHHNHSVRSTPENHLMALELVTGETGNQLSSFNRNIIQICLYLEGIGTFAKVRHFEKYFGLLKCSHAKQAAYSCTLLGEYCDDSGVQICILMFLCTTHVHIFSRQKNAYATIIECAQFIYNFISREKCYALP